MWSHYADRLRGFSIALDKEVIMHAAPEGYLLDVSYLEAPPNVDSFVYAIAQDKDWYSQTAIEETNYEIKHLGKSKLRATIPIYEESGTKALRKMREI
jgi:Protein of unknown function (DUF2971)